MEDINILELKDETHTFYLKDDLEDFFLGYLDIFDSDLKSFFENITSEEKKLQHSLKRLLVFCKSMVVCIIF